MQNQRTASEIAHANAVRSMFAGIARRYDLLNHVLSVNIDKRWRRRVRAELAEVLADRNAIILDVACGTGDLSIELGTGASAVVIGTDFCRPMLDVAAKKTSGLRSDIPFLEADAMQLPLPDQTFDAVTIAFGLRNLSHFADGLAELHRVLKPGGRLVVLEFSTPTVPGFASLFDLYFTRILPRIGGAVSGSRGAYEYLPDSVQKFPDQKRLVELMSAVGFAEVRFSNLTGGIAAIHTGTRSS